MTVFFQGFPFRLYLLCTRPYVLCILIVSTTYEIITQIIEYQTLSAAHAHPYFSTHHGFAQFQGIFGIAINSVSLVIALCGTNYCIKRYGIKWCLLIVPTILLLLLTCYVIFSLIVTPTNQSILCITMIMMIVIDGSDLPCTSR